MKHIEFFITSSDNLKLYCQTWQPESDFSKQIILLHGMGEHSTRYDHWAKRFVNQGFAVFSFDSRGHGKSEGKRGDSPDYEQLMSDIDLFFREVEIKSPKKTTVLYGHSLGGNLAINYVLRRNPKIVGLIATSPWLRLAFEPPKFKLWLARTMFKILPSLTQPSGLVTSDISQDSAEVKKYETDLLVHGKISIRMLLGVFDACEYALQNAHLLEVPTLFLHGSGDKIISYKATEECAQKAKNSTIKIFKNLYHELHHEKEREEVFEQIANWLKNVVMLGVRG